MIKERYPVTVMFTGIIEAQGSLYRRSQSQVEVIWHGLTDDIAHDLALGDSVAVDGACLTIAQRTATGFVADVSPETISRTTLAAGRPVNLERSLRVGGKVGGHFVTGHIDGMGELVRATAVADAWELWFTAPPSLLRYLAPKGSIAINGISLTLAEVRGDHFSAAVIPHTYETTNLAALNPHDPVNLEGDVLAKYIEAQLRPSTEPVSLGFLQEHGYA